MLEKIVTGLVLTVIALVVLAAYLPRTAPYVVVIAAVVIAVRLVWFYTNRF
jgi:hypothetical protein